jgi:hypothetical protein
MVEDAAYGYPARSVLMPASVSAEGLQGAGQNIQEVWFATKVQLNF